MLCCGMLTARADHISGGEIFYTYNGRSGSQYVYTVYLRLFMLCSSSRQFDNPAIISVFNKGNNVRVLDSNVPLQRTTVISLTNTNLCITNPPVVCYKWLITSLVCLSAALQQDILFPTRLITV